jgi:hypothetical protein
MTIGEEAKAWFDQYEQQEGQNSFSATVVRCLFYGLLVKRDNFILMAEPVLTDGKRIVAIGSECGSSNCWWIYYLAAPRGATTPYDWMAEAPYPLPYFAFKRRKKLKIYTWNQAKKDIGKDKDVYGRSTPSFSTTSA